jgi:hypothetical protein
MERYRSRPVERAAGTIARHALTDYGSFLVVALPCGRALSPDEKPRKTTGIAAAFPHGVTDRPRVIVSLPNTTEAAAVSDWLLTDGFNPVKRGTAQAAADEMLLPFALLIADVSHRRLLMQSRGRNPLMPTILIGNAATASSGDALGAQTMYLSRPIDRAMFTCFVAMAMLDSRPVRRSVRKPVNRFDAVANGVPSHIVDVSPEGLRLEMSRDRRAALPPYFTVRVPLVGVAVTVQRMWTQSSTGRESSIWYGGALSQNRSNITQAWKSFVDHIPVVGQTGLVLNP